ncbi:MAG: hypothetical protein AAGK23_05925 [Pseudomonadota bacterium]
MTILVIRVLILMVLAALMGAGLAYWWLRRNFEDVTERFESLTEEQARFSDGPPPLTKAEFDAGLAAIPRPDFSPFERKIGALETSFQGFAVPEPDFSPVLQRLEMVEAYVSGTDPDIEAMGARLNSLEGMLTSITASLSGLENANLEPVQAQLDHLANRIDAIPVPDLEGLSGQLGAMASTVEKQTGPDLRPLEARMSRLEGAIQAVQPQELDIGPLHSGLARLELLIEGLKIPPATDLDPITGQIDHMVEKLAEIGQNISRADLEALRGQMGAMSSTLATMQLPDLSPLRDRLAVIERLVGGLTLPDVDLRPVLQQIERLEAQVRAPNPDIETLQSRFIGLETAVSTFGQSNLDLEPVHRQLELIKAHLMAPNQNFDTINARLAGLNESLATVEAGFTAMRAQMNAGQGLEPLERRLAGLQDAFLGLRQPDMTPVMNQIRSMDSRIDLGAVESRLTAIEYSLAAVHQMLRSNDLAVNSVQTRYAPPLPAQLETRGLGEAPPPPMPDEIEPDTVSSTPDALAVERRPGDKSNLLVRAAFGEADDLQQISGVGPKLSRMLNEIGVYYFWQIAEWKQSDIDWVDGLLEEFPGRISRDNWVGQAEVLCQQPQAAKRPGQ